MIRLKDRERGLVCLGIRLLVPPPSSLAQTLNEGTLLLNIIPNLTHSPTNAPMYFGTRQVEVVAVLASAMGTLDVAAGVICGDATTAPGWRLMGVVEMALALLFLFWFMKKGRAFLSAAQWKPALNVAQRRMYTALDADGDGSVGDTVGCTALSIAHTGRLNERTNDE